MLKNLQVASLHIKHQTRIQLEFLLMKFCGFVEYIINTLHLWRVSGNKGYPINNTAESICVSAQAAPNLIFAQPQFTGASGHPQLFIAGPNPPQTGGMSYPQILIPINPSPHIQPNLGIANCLL